MPPTLGKFFAVGDCQDVAAAAAAVISIATPVGTNNFMTRGMLPRARHVDELPESPGIGNCQNEIDRSITAILAILAILAIH